MCATGVSFAVLSRILKLAFSVLNEDKNFRLSPSRLFKRYQKIAEVKELEYHNEIREKNSFGTVCFDHHSMKQLSGKFLTKEHRLASVSLKFLTGLRENLTKSNQAQFNTLQSPSNARFMASAIQGLNCFLFRNELDWDSLEREQIKQRLPRFRLFLTLIYVRHWNRSSILFDAGINDLNFLKELEEYIILDDEISRIAMNALSRHLYYLSEELVILCLFSDKMSPND